MCTALTRLIIVNRIDIDEPSCLSEKNIFYLKVTIEKKQNKKSRLSLSRNVSPLVSLANNLIKSDKGLPTHRTDVVIMSVFTIIANKK